MINKAKSYFLKTFKKKKNPIYPYLPRHVTEVEKWTKKILQNYPKADKKVVLLAVWLHDIGHVVRGQSDDHAVKSEAEARRFLSGLKISSEMIEKVAHCVRAHRCREVQPRSLEAKILAVSDSASHLTDFNYLVHIQDGERDYALGKLERDYRDVGLLPNLKNELTPLYKAWKQLLEVYPEQ